MSWLPGRASSLASIGLLFALCVVVAALGGQQSASRSQPGLPVAQASATPNHHAGSTNRNPSGHKATRSTTVPLVTENFKCPPARGAAGAQPGTHLIESARHGDVLMVDTFCRGSTWYVSENISGASTVSATPFRVPEDPPIPTAVTVERFIPLGGLALPAALVLRERFAGASIYEMFTVVGDKVEPMVLSPGSSPMLFLHASYELQGAGFSCSETSSGEVIRQYQWYVVNPTTLKTDPRGDVTGDPEVFFETTEYDANSANTFTTTTLPIVMRGYRSAEKLSGGSC